MSVAIASVLIWTATVLMHFKIVFQVIMIQNQSTSLRLWLPLPTDLNFRYLIFGGKNFLFLNLTVGMREIVGKRGKKKDTWGVIKKKLKNKKKSTLPGFEPGIP